MYLESTFIYLYIFIRSSYLAYLCNCIFWHRTNQLCVPPAHKVMTAVPIMKSISVCLSVGRPSVRPSARPSIQHTQVPLLDRSAPFMNDIAVSKDGVFKFLKGLNPSKALGPDELHPRVLKELATELGPVFAHLFQQSIDTSEIPKEWPLANICPLFKKSDRSLACNYRPVSLTCVLCKLL